MILKETCMETRDLAKDQRSRGFNGIFASKSIKFRQNSLLLLDKIKIF